MALPEDHSGVAELFLGVAAQPLEGIPDHHFVQGNAKLEGGVAAQVLVGEEEDPLGPLKGPLQDGGGVGGGADGAVVAAAEGLDAGDGVHVGDGYDAAVVAEHVLQVVPGIFHVVHGGHVGHGAAGGDVGENDLLVGRAEDAGGLGHEVDAAEDDVAGLGAGCGLLGEEEGIALEVGVLDDFLALVVVAEDGHVGAELLADVVDAPVQFLGGKAQVFGGDSLPADVDGQFLGQGLGGEFVLGAAEGGVLDFGQGYGGRPGLCCHIHILARGKLPAGEGLQGQGAPRRRSFSSSSRIRASAAAARDSAAMRPSASSSWVSR